MLKTKARDPSSAGTAQRRYRYHFPIDTNAAHIDSVAAKAAVEIDPSQIIVAGATDDRGRLAQARRLIDEDRRRARGKGPGSVIGSMKPSPRSVAMISTRIADGEDRLYRSAHPVAAVDIVGLRNDVVSAFAG